MFVKIVYSYNSVAPPRNQNPTSAKTQFHISWSRIHQKLNENTWFNLYGKND